MNIEKEIKELTDEEFKTVSRIANWINDSKLTVEYETKINLLNKELFKRAEKEIHGD